MAHKVNELRKLDRLGKIVTFEDLEALMAAVITSTHDAVVEMIEEAREEIREEIAAATAPKPRGKKTVKADAQETPPPAQADAQPELVDLGVEEEEEEEPAAVDVNELLEGIFPETADNEADDTTPSEETTK